MKKLTTMAIVLTLVLFTGCSNRSSSEDVKTSSNKEISSQVDSTAVTTTTVADTTTTAVTTTTVADTTTTAETTTTESKLDYPEIETRNRVLPVDNIQQLPELPSGSSITSAAILLNSFGLWIDKMDLLNYLPIVKTPNDNGVWPSFFEAYLGDPETEGYGCYSSVIKQTITNLFEKNNATDYKVADFTGTLFEDLIPEIEKGYAMMIWATKNMEDPNMISLSITEGTFEWPENANCVVLMGYDLDRGIVVVSDPSDPKGTVEYPIDVVKKVYDRLGRQALTIHLAK